MDNEDVVLLITEGEKLDKRILNQVQSLFLPNQKVKIFPICLNIYNLYSKMIESDDFGTEFIDVFSVIQAIAKEQTASNNPELLALKRNQISEIFLFFDYDGHDTLAPIYQTCIENMFELFNDETENGKLYINYPMVESYKHPIQDNIEVIDIFTDIHYKTHVALICDKKIENIGKLKEKNDWLNIFNPHIKSSNHLFVQEFLFPQNYSETLKMSQREIYKRQKEQYIHPENKIMVLSSFSWFLLEYLGEKLFLEWQTLANSTQDLQNELHQT